MRHVSNDTCGTRDLCEVGVLLNVGTESVGSIDGAGCLIPVSVHVITESCHLLALTSASGIPPRWQHSGCRCCSGRLSQPSSARPSHSRPPPRPPAASGLTWWWTPRGPPGWPADQSSGSGCPRWMDARDKETWRNQIITSFGTGFYISSPVSRRIGLGAWHSSVSGLGSFSSPEMKSQNGFPVKSPWVKSNSPGPSVVPGEGKQKV